MVLPRRRISAPNLLAILWLFSCCFVAFASFISSGESHAGENWNLDPLAHQIHSFKCLSSWWDWVTKNLCFKIYVNIGVSHVNVASFLLCRSNSLSMWSPGYAVLANWTIWTPVWKLTWISKSICLRRRRSTQSAGSMIGFKLALSVKVDHFFQFVQIQSRQYFWALGWQLIQSRWSKPAVAFSRRLGFSAAKITTKLLIPRTGTPNNYNFSSPVICFPPLECWFIAEHNEVFWIYIFMLINSIILTWKDDLESFSVQYTLINEVFGRKDDWSIYCDCQLQKYILPTS